MIRSLRVVSTVLVAVSSLAGCGLGEKQEQADAVVAAVERVVASGSASGTLAVSQRVVSEPPAAVDDDGAAPSPAASDREPPPLVVDVALDLDANHSSATFPGSEHPYAVFDDMDLYARRYAAGERDARPWVHVRGERLQKDNGGLASRDAIFLYAGFALNPSLLLDLAAAPLTGSMKALGVDRVAGVETRRYAANFDIEKMVDDTRESAYPDERREMVDTLLDLLVVSGSTHSGEVWLDTEGRLRRFDLSIRQHPFADLELDLVLRLELTDIGGPVAVAVPGPRALVSVGTIRQFLSAAVPPPGSDEFVRAFLGAPDA